MERQTSADDMSTDPATWSVGEIAELQRESLPFAHADPTTGSAHSGMVVGSTGRLAVRAGVKALEAGGTAADAALTTALGQIALAAGAWVSYAGLLGLVYYDAASGEVSSLSAGFATCRDEDDPMSIPRDATPSGRTTMVPGFMSGVQAAHDRFGALAWADLFAPAIWIADQGFELGPGRERHIDMRTDVLGRWQQTRAIFQKPDGAWRGVGDTIRQTELADTLRAVASEGGRHMTEGAWARSLVEALRAMDGKMTLDDLASYEPSWDEPLRGRFRDHDVAALAAPNTGGAMLIEGLHLAEACDLRSMGDPAKSDEALYWLIQIVRQTHVLSTVPPEVRATPEHARALWRLMRERGAFVGPGAVRAGTHSDYVIAADENGNVAAMCHTSNVSVWGLTGLFVGGIAVPDAARFQPEVVAHVGGGNHVPNPLNPGIVLRDGRPRLAWSSIGAGLVEATLQCVAGVIDRDHPVTDVVTRPMFLGPAPIPGETIVGGAAPPEQAIPDTDLEDEDADPLGIWRNYLRRMPQGVDPGTFESDVLEGVRRRGQEIVEMEPLDASAVRGHWGGIEIAPDGTKLGARTGGVNGTVDGY